MASKKPENHVFALPDLPDVPRAGAFADRLRGVDDEHAAALLVTSEGAWFYADALPYTDGATRHRVLKLVVGRVPPSPLELERAHVGGR